MNPTNLPATRPSTDQDIIMVIGDFGGDARTAGKVVGPVNLVKKILKKNVINIDKDGSLPVFKLYN